VSFLRSLATLFATHSAQNSFCPPPRHSPARPDASIKNSDELVPQPHAGALLPGGKRRNAGGGRPRDVIREAYLKLLTDKGVALPCLNTTRSPRGSSLVEQRIGVLTLSTQALSY
jgi:hypothetical protein